MATARAHRAAMNEQQARPGQMDRVQRRSRELPGAAPPTHRVACPWSGGTRAMLQKASATTSCRALGVQ